MSGLETNLKSTSPRPGRYETKTETETETLKIGLETSLETSITAVTKATKQGKVP